VLRNDAGFASQEVDDGVVAKVKVPGCCKSTTPASEITLLREGS
jgi:hypothetical protein